MPTVSQLKNRIILAREKLAALAKNMDEAMNVDDDPRCPTGDDYSDLHHAVTDYVQLIKNELRTD